MYARVADRCDAIHAAYSSAFLCPSMTASRPNSNPPAPIQLRSAKPLSLPHAEWNISVALDCHANVGPSAVTIAWRDAVQKACSSALVAATAAAGSGGGGDSGGAMTRLAGSSSPAGKLALGGQVEWSGIARIRGLPKLFASSSSIGSSVDGGPAIAVGGAGEAAGGRAGARP